MKFIVIHGSFGHPNENWFPWLKSELEKLGHKVFVPHFPTRDNILEKWLDVFKEYEKHLDKNTILIGRSLGVPFILTLLENHKAKASFLVAGFTGLLNIGFDKINKPISDKKFDWDKIKKNCKKYFIYNSDNDPYVPLEKGKELAANLKTQLKIVVGAAHFNKKAGYKEFPLLLEDIKCAAL